MVKDASGQGKHLFIWDCDADMAQDFDSLRPRDFMLGTQVKLIQVAKQKGRIDGVWYGGGEAAGRVTCLCELLVYKKGPHGPRVQMTLVAFANSLCMRTTTSGQPGCA